MNVFAALHLAKNLGPDDVIVSIICDTGERYLTKHHSDEWLAEKQLLPDDSPSVGLVLASKVRGSSVPALVAVQHSSTVAETLQHMQKYGISQIPVLDGDLVTGNVRENKLMAAVIENREAMIHPVGQYAEAAPPIVESHEDIAAAIRLLRDNTYVLVHEYQRVVGVLSRHDVLQFL
jgi:cystathionine beta-synthase